MGRMVRISSIVVTLAAVLAYSAQAAPVAGYAVAKSIPLGPPDRWDYLTYDGAAARLYAAHSSTVDVLDGHSGEVLGRVAVPGANGIALASAAGKGYAGSREHKSVVVFDLKSLKVIREIPADEDTDAVIYDPHSKRVFVMEGDPHRALAIDTATDQVAGRIELGGSPEFAAVDGNGQLFINLEDQRAIVRIDTRSLKLEARWPIAACESPHGLAMDSKARRLFAS